MTDFNEEIDVPDELVQEIEEDPEVDDFAEDDDCDDCDFDEDEDEDDEELVTDDELRQPED